MCLNILVIDDDKTDRIAVKRSLLQDGKQIDISEAESGLQAIEMVKTNSFDCIFLDYRLPDMDGISVLRKLYDENADCLPSPTVILTGQGNESVMLDAIRYGAQDYLVKDNISADTLSIALTKAQQAYYLKRELAEAKRLQSIGQLAAGIAHEINTPIQYVGDNTHFLEDAFKDFQQLLQKIKTLVENIAEESDKPGTVKALNEIFEEFDYEYLSEDIPKSIEQSLEGIRRVTSIVKAMKDFSHPGSDSKEPLDINRAVESTVAVTRNIWKLVANLDLNLDPDVGEVHCFGNRLNEVILNIIVNAAHAIEAKKDNTLGKIFVTTQRMDAYVEITISDTGMGIPEHAQAKVFDPFFTTKEVGRGTGQGLSICHNIIVNQHQGELFFETEENIGTRFYIRLPCD